MASSSKHERWWWLLPVVVVPVLLAIPAFLGKVLLYRDVLGLILPQQVVRARALAEGRLPEWNPLSYGGTPFLADPGTGVFYPGNPLFQLFTPAHAATIFILLHVALAGAGALLLLREEGRTRATAAIGAAVYASSGYLLSMHGMHYALSSAALLPLAVALLLRAGKSGKTSQIALAALVVALVFFNGEWQAALFAAGIAFVRLLVDDDRLRALARMIAAVIAGALLAAVQLVPTMLFTRETTRAHGLPFADATNWSLHPLRWIEFLLPSPFGMPYPDNTYFGTSLLDSGRTAPWAVSLTLAGAFVLLALAGPWRKEGRSAIAWAVLGAAALLLAAGQHTPLFELWYRFVPFADRFRYPEKYAEITTLALVVLGARTLDEADQRVRIQVLLIAAAVLGIAAAIVTWSPPTALESFVLKGLAEAKATITAPAAIRSLAGSLGRAALVSFAVALALAGRMQKPAFGTIALAVIVLLDGATHGLGILSYGDGRFLETTPLLVQKLRAQTPAESTGRIYRDRCPFVDRPGGGTLLERVRRWEWDSGKSNFPTLFGIPDTVGYGPAESAEKWRVFKTLAPVNSDGLLRLLGTAIRIDCSGGDVHAEPFPHPLPRVAMVAPRLVSEEQVLTQLGDPAFDPSREALVTDQRFTAPATPGATAQLVEDRPESLRIRTTGAGLLQVADTFADGWEATVDGASAPIARVNALWRGVLVTDGAHEVVLRYRTPGLRTGTIVSLLALVLLGALLLLSRRVRAR